MKAYFKSMAAHHAEAARCHTKMAGKCDGAAREFHETMSTSHVEAGEAALAACKACGDDQVDTHDNGRMKVALGSPMEWAMNLERMVPTNAHGVLPDNPMRKLVGRPGENNPPLPEADDATRIIDQFAR